MTNVEAHDSQIPLDFLGTSQPPKPQPQPHPRLDRRRSFRDISKMNPEIVKSVIASSGSKTNIITSPTALPDPHPTFANLREQGSLENTGKTAPVTIFYNGTVSVFDLPKEKAQDVIMLAKELEKNSSKNESCSNAQAQNILHPLGDADMPIKRKKSLQRFFEKRKERLIPLPGQCASPSAYSIP